VTDTHVEWKVTARVPSKPSPVLIDGWLYMVHDGGVASCLEAATGQEVWRQRIDGNYSASPIVAGGRIYFFNQEGAATVIEPGRQFHALAVNQLDAGCLASPAALGRALYVRTETHLYRIEGSR
jgi:outer membrane protein assembly factor BamB